MLTLVGRCKCSGCMCALCVALDSLCLLIFFCSVICCFFSILGPDLIVVGVQERSFALLVSCFFLSLLFVGVPVAAVVLVLVFLLLFVLCVSVSFRV